MSRLTFRLTALEQRLRPRPNGITDVILTVPGHAPPDAYTACPVHPDCRTYRTGLITTHLMLEARYGL
jgi:hypothetical protein